ncbi:MAG: T9SS type A sorting domain-containing protein [Saprospiraceae bacterium]|nr:T9SS type A sorting domain-containing protein [Saprospiraceae bacterium]
MKNIYNFRLPHYLFVLLGLFVCSTLQAQFTVSGKLETPTGATIPFYKVLISGAQSQTVLTDQNGNFTVSLQAGEAYSVQPLHCKDYALNGVTSFDMILIDKHITGVQPLNNPYKIIAADVSNNQLIGNFDTTLMRRLILGIETEIPAGNYRSVPKSYNFPNPQNPFFPPFPESYFIPNLDQNHINVDFVVIKIGDVNNTCIYVSNEQCQNFALPSKISGSVFQDNNLDCTLQTGENGLNGWLVSAYDGDNQFSALTQENGTFSIGLVPGTYDLVVTKPNQLWDACTDTIYDVTVADNATELRNFAMQVVNSCPQMDVSLSTLGLRRCFVNIYKVSYCNLGTSTANDARVEVVLDPFFEFSSSTTPSTPLGNNTYSFDLGDVPSGFCGDFNIIFTLSCDAVLGQTHCIEASIFPDTVCNSPASNWAGADLHVTGTCVQDQEVKFTVTNHGGMMTQASNYIVVEDIVVMTPPVQNPFTLASNEQMIITVPATGATVRLEVEQPEGHPWSDKASATVEGCGTNPSGGFSLGMVNQFPIYDQAPYTDTDCRENTGSFDPNDKQGFPKGVSEEHYIPLNQAIDYLIRFQNTGTDTAFTVVVRDTIDANFDVSSLKITGSSHAYRLDILEGNVLQFTFNHIMLPDSNVNEPLSHGYVSFQIKPREGLQEGVVVKNFAAIYFDFNEPVVTNTTSHTYGSQFLEVNHLVFEPDLALEMFPNPTAGELNFLLKSPNQLEGELIIYDNRGRIALKQPFQHNNFTMKGDHLPSGVYFFRIISNEQLMAGGKFIVVDEK